MKPSLYDVIRKGAGLSARQRTEATASQVPATESAAWVADARAKAEAEGRAAGAAAERARALAIIGMVDDFSNTALVEAAHAAVRDQMTTEQARAVVASVKAHTPRATAQTRLPGIAYCAGHNLGPDDAFGDAPDAQQEAARVLGLYADVKGRKVQ